MSIDDDLMKTLGHNILSHLLPLIILIEQLCSRVADAASPSLRPKSISNKL